MLPLEPPDNHFLNAATGWLQLGNVVEARAEFDQLSPVNRAHPEVLDCEWRLLARERRWSAAADAGDRWVQACPDHATAWVHRSFALHELRRTREAFDQLLPAATRFPAEALIPYNLACYTCQLGDLAAARRWLDRALALDGEKRGRIDRLETAVADPDLQPLRAELEEHLAGLRATPEAGG